MQWRSQIKATLFGMGAGGQPSSVLRGQAGRAVVRAALHRAPNGRFYVRPDKTTTFTLTVVGTKGRTVRRQLTVEAPPGN